MILNTILQGDVLDRLKDIPDGSINCIVTSPPYYALRDYGVAGQIGLEQTPEEYIAKMVDVFRECRRVLRDDGTLWVNIGDTYCSTAPGSTGDPHFIKELATNAAEARRKKRPQTPDGMKPKDLMGIPWMLAFALRADGWYLRQDIIWHKPNPMPESCRDRCTKAHEYIFLLSKSQRYYASGEGLREPVESEKGNANTFRGGAYCDHQTFDNAQGGRRRVPGNKSHKGTEAYRAGDEHHRTKAGLIEYAERQRAARDSFRRENSKRAVVHPGQSMGTHRPDRKEDTWDTGYRNRRSVWTVATRPFSEAHFATFPPDLIEPCILAGCPEGGTVLDPFMGAGTTAVVAEKHGRKWLGIELNPEYIEIATRRIETERKRPAAEPAQAEGQIRIWEVIQ